MFSARRLPSRGLAAFALVTGGTGFVWAMVVYGLYAGAGFDWLRVPFLPLSVMGIAVSFYGGFKNNASYDRFWEGRKIWGAIVNESRSWASGVLCYVRPGDESDEARAVRRELVYRHLAWINALRLQLRRESRFFDNPARGTAKRLAAHATHMRNDWDAELAPFLPADELTATSAMVNPATHLVHRHGAELADLFRTQKTDLFHQIALMGILRELYTLQGKCERIKKTPFPRQYAEFSRIFTRVFVYLVPFGLLDVFADHLPAGIPTAANLPWLLPYFAASTMIAWVFLTMDGIGDASEDPFERSMNDVPMNALCRVIERDLRQLLGETELPPAEQPIDGILY
ncbi:MAG: bestrophin family ion channel [Myxococcota bacterium]